jgi:UDP-GlcNAc:undecaprenyl-phosphate GlcNAc-1-phosphate transferase
MTLALLAVFAAALLMSAALTRAAVGVSRRVGFLDRPAGRKSHSEPTPLGGGVAVFLSFAGVVAAGLAGAWAVSAAGWADRLPPTLAEHLPGVLRKAPVAWGLLATAAGLHLVGLYDDARNLPPLLKLAAQLAAAAVAVLALDVRATFFVGEHWVTAAASILWIALCANSFNFLDNMDGLCAGVAVVCGGVLLAGAVLNGEHFIAATLAALTGSAAGFLIWNFHPARIFLGDAGSQVIGFLFGCVTLLATWYGGRTGITADDNPAARSAVFVPVVALAVPLYDTASVILIRLREGRPPWVGDNRHFSHRLRARGLSVRQTALTVYLCTFATASGSLFLGRVGMTQAVMVFVQTLAVLGVLAILESSSSVAGHSSLVTGGGTHEPEASARPAQRPNGLADASGSSDGK